MNTNPVAVPSARVSGIGVDDGVGQTAGGSNHGHRSVGQAVKLVQPARFEQAGHRGRYRRRPRSGGPARRKSPGDAQNLPGCRRARSSSRAWYSGMPLAQNHHLDVSLQQPVGHLGQQVPAFLRVETTDLGEQRDVGTLGQARPSAGARPCNWLCPATTLAAS